MVFFFSCQKDKELFDSVLLPVPQQKYDETNLFPQGIQLENPYTVENILKAYDNLYP